MALVVSRVSSIERRDTVPLAESLGRRLASSVAARMDLPPFDQSAMDGYALAGSSQADVYALFASKGTRAGGGSMQLETGQAARIATGARMPPGADRVVLHEHAREHGDSLILTDGPILAGANVRRRGEDVHQGDIVLPRGEKIDPRKIAMLAAQGCASVDVISSPRIAVLSSGSELRQPGEPLGDSNVYDCNRPMLIALARRAGAHVSDGGCYADDMQTLSREITHSSGHSDLVLISGGSSVGDADLTSAALRHAGAQVEELKIALKPGKPALIATLGQTTILGLPGNPVAAFASWFTLGRSVLARMFGLRNGLLQGRELTVINELHRRPSRAELVPARQVRTVLGIQLEFIGPAGSARLSPLSSADGFALVESNRGVIAAGEIVTFLPFEDGEVL